MWPMDRVVGLAPSIINTNDIRKQQLDATAYMVHARMTKQLDVAGKYRTSIRTSIYLIKCLWQILVFVWVMLLYTRHNAAWFQQHYIELDRESVQHPMYLHTCINVIFVYLWEISTDRYGKTPTALLIHHTTSIISATAVFCFGFYSPFLYLYLTFMIAFYFPVNFAFAFRAAKARQFPQFTRRLLRAVLIYYLLLWIAHLSLQIGLIVHVLQHPEKVPHSVVIITVVAFCGFAYDDYQVGKALIAFSRLKYELLSPDASLSFASELQQLA